MLDFYDGTKYRIDNPNYHAPNKFNHFEKTLVGTFTVENGNDGLSCSIFETRTPSQFYELVLENGFSFKTGSGQDMGELLFKIAEQISCGMLGIYKD